MTTKRNTKTEKYLKLAKFFCYKLSNLERNQSKRVPNRKNEIWFNQKNQRVLSVMALNDEKNTKL